MNWLFIILCIIGAFVVGSDAYIFYKINQKKIDEETLEKLKLEYNTNNNFNIYKTARKKYFILLVLLLVLPILIILFIYKMFNVPTTICVYAMLGFLLIFQYCAILETQILNKLYKCPVCKSKLNTKINVKKIETREQSPYIKNMDLFFQCDKCNLKVYEEKK